jgi:hypothetical protein
MLVAAYSFVAEMYFAHSRLAIIVAGVYSVFVLIIGADVIRNRRARDYLQASVLREFFADMNREVFADDALTRFTLFRVSPFDEKRIVPWYRYDHGTDDVISEAQRSRASYRKGEGFTGDAWLRAGNQLVFASFPAFSDRREFEEYYRNTIGIKAETVNEISDFMMNVRTILSYGFVDEAGGFLGLLSIDLRNPVTITTEGMPMLGDRHLYGDALAQHLHSIGTALKGFVRGEVG